LSRKVFEAGIIDSIVLKGVRDEVLKLFVLERDLTLVEYFPGEDRRMGWPYKSGLSVILPFNPFEYDTWIIHYSGKATQRGMLCLSRFPTYPYCRSRPDGIKGTIFRDFDPGCGLDHRKGGGLQA